MNRRLHITVRGRVQGVFFRASTQERARDLGVVGWVRNQPDGAVQLVAEGPGDTLDELLRWCRSGPPGARVDSLDAVWSDALGDLDTFHIAR